MNVATLLNRFPSFHTQQIVGSIIAPFIGCEQPPYPHFLTFAVTRRCQARCVMCNIWREKYITDLTLDQIRSIFSRGDFIHARSLTLTGGEPTLRADLSEILEIALSTCPRIEHVYLATNGLSPKRVIGSVRQMCEAISNYPMVRVFDVQISLDGVGRIQEDLRGIPGAFLRVQETLSGIQELREKYPFLMVRFSSLVTPLNFSGLAELCDFAHAQAIPIQLSPLVFSDSYYANVHDTTLKFDKNTLNEVVRFFDRLGSVDPSSLQFYYKDVARMLQGAKRGRLCMMGYYGVTLEHDGMVYACVNSEDFSFGNLLEAPFQEIWFGKQAAIARRLVRQRACPDCPSMCYFPESNLGEAIQLRWQKYTGERRRRQQALSQAGCRVACSVD